MEDKAEVRVQGQEEKVYYTAPSKNIRMYYEYTEDHFRKGQDYNLKVKKFARIQSWEKDDRGILLRLQGDCIYNTQIDCDGELRPVEDELHEPEHFEAFLRVEPYQKGIFRLLAGMGTEEKSHTTVMQEGVSPLKEESYTLSEKEGKLWIETESAMAAFTLEDFSFALYKKDGSCVYRQENNDKVLNFTYESFPFGFVENPATKEQIAVCSSRMEFDESFYGFGEQFSPADKRMQEVDVFITDPLSVGSSRTYISLPFYLSSRGYGLYVNTHFRSKFFMGNRSNRSTSFHVYGEPLLDLFYLVGEEPKDILRSYTDITGKSPMVPRWSFGLWMSRCSYQTEEEVLGIARQMRERDLPCDVINIDTDWFEIPWACDWKFGTHNFPHAKQMIEELKEMGIKLSLWQKPYITSEFLPELEKMMLEKGWLPLNDEGKPARFNPTMDLSNPDCVRWYKEQLKRLHEMGVSVIKTDMAEGVPPEAQYYAYSGEEIRNIYSYLYSRAAFEAAEEAGIRQPMLWGRSTYAGGQKYPIHWGGDAFTDFDGLRYSIRSGLSMGMSGFTYWSHDIGGFLGRPTEEVYIRWMQAGMFCSHTRCHGANNPREPWTFGERAEEIFRKFDKLRYALLPYIYSTAYETSREGLPMMEHLYLSNPKDRNCRSIEDEWMFGPAFLVAPVLQEGNQREVYFPQGTWYSYFSNEITEGGRFLTVKAELEELPLYVKAGSIVPLGEVSSYVKEEKSCLSCIQLYYQKGAKTSFVYFDGEREYELKADFAETEVSLDLDGLPETVEVSLIGEFGCLMQTDVKGSCRFAL